MNEGAACPARWAPATLGEVARPQRPKIAPRSRPELPFIGMENVEAQTMRLLGTVPAGSMKSNAVHFLPGDVLYGRLRPYLNKVIAPPFEGLCSAEFIPLTPAPGIAHRFLQFRLNAADFVAFASRAEGDRPRVDYDRIATFPLLVPPTPEQHRIVSAIESYFTRLDDAVASLERVQRNLKRYRASVLKAAVEGRLVPTEAELARQEGRDYEPAEVLLKRILAERRRRWEEAEQAKMKAGGKLPKDDRWKAKYKEPLEPSTEGLPELPEGWCWATLDHLLLAIEAGKNFKCVERPPGEDEVGVVKVSAVTWGTFDEIESKTCPRADLLNEHHLIRPGDFLFSRANTMQLVGACVIVHAATKSVMLSDKILRLRLLGAMDEWALLVMRSELGRSEIESRATGNQESMRNISQASIRKLRVPIPPAAECARILGTASELLSTADACAHAADANASRGTRLRQAILRWAFEGRLADQDPTDEPASALLGRVKAERAEASPKPKARAGRRTKVTA